MKQTLLQLTQEILASMDAEEVNSITDTTESLQVARLVRQAYFDLIDDLDPPEHYIQFELDASTDSTKPTLMTVPEDVSKVIWVKYDCIASGETAPNFQLITYMEKQEFVNNMHMLSTDDTRVGTFDITTIDSSSMPVYYYNDRAPLYYTTLDDNTVLFDAYDATVDSTLQKTKTYCYGRKNINFNLEDNVIPDLDANSFQRLLNEAKQLAFAELKSVSHVLADRNSKRARARSFKNKFRVVGQSDFDQLPNFGWK